MSAKPTASPFWQDAQYRLIVEFGDAVTGLLEQMLKDNWVDDQGHTVIVNTVTSTLMDVVDKAIELREGVTKAGGGENLTSHNALVAALESIAKSYPVTDEGETLAAIAKDALTAAGAAK